MAIPRVMAFPGVSKTDSANSAVESGKSIRPAYHMLGTAGVVASRYASIDAPNTNASAPAYATTDGAAIESLVGANG